MRVLVERWPGWIGGAVVGLVGTAAYLRSGPLGVTAELGATARRIAGGSGLLPEQLYGLDAIAGCATVVRDTLMTPNGMFVLAMVLGALAGGIVSGAFRPEIPTRRHVARGLIGGVLLGWGAMTAVGCSIGTLLSGISAFAVSGWVFLVGMTLGTVLGLSLLRERAR